MKVYPEIARAFSYAQRLTHDLRLKEFEAGPTPKLYAEHQEIFPLLANLTAALLEPGFERLELPGLVDGAYLCTMLATSASLSYEYWQSPCEELEDPSGYLANLKTAIAAVEKNGLDASMELIKPYLRPNYLLREATKEYLLQQRIFQELTFICQACLAHAREWGAHDLARKSAKLSELLTHRKEHGDEHLSVMQTKTFLEEFLGLILDLGLESCVSKAPTLEDLRAEYEAARENEEQA